MDIVIWREYQLNEYPEFWSIFYYDGHFTIKATPCWILLLALYLTKIFVFSDENLADIPEYQLMQNMVESFHGDSTRVESSPKGFRASVRKSFRESTLMRDATLRVLEKDNFLTRYCIIVKVDVFLLGSLKWPILPCWIWLKGTSSRFDVRDFSSSCLKFGVIIQRELNRWIKF